MGKHARASIPEDELYRSINLSRIKLEKVEEVVKDLESVLDDPHMDHRAEGKAFVELLKRLLEAGPNYPVIVEPSDTWR